VAVGWLGLGDWGSLAIGPPRRWCSSGPGAGSGSTPTSASTRSF